MLTSDNLTLLESWRKHDVGGWFHANNVWSSCWGSEKNLIQKAFLFCKLQHNCVKHKCYGHVPCTFNGNILFE